MQKTTKGFQYNVKDVYVFRHDQYLVKFKYGFLYSLQTDAENLAEPKDPASVNDFR